MHSVGNCVLANMLTGMRHARGPGDASIRANNGHNMGVRVYPAGTSFHRGPSGSGNP